MNVSTIEYKCAMDLSISKDTMLDETLLVCLSELGQWMATPLEGRDNSDETQDA